MKVLETDRLVLRHFTPADAADNYRLYTDPEIMRFMGRQPDSVEFERYHIQKHIENYYEKHGFGLWAMVLKETGQLVGRCGLIYQEIEGERLVEVSYLLDKDYWGRGLTTEAARAVVRLGFEKYNFPRLIAVIDHRNIASIRVAEKIGMKYERDILFRDFGKVAMYAMERNSVEENQT